MGCENEQEVLVPPRRVPLLCVNLLRACIAQVIVIVFCDPYTQLRYFQEPVFSLSALLRFSYFLAWASRNPFFCTRWLELTPVLLLWLQRTTSSSTGSGILPRTSASSEDGSTYCPLYFRFGVQLHLLALHECHFPLCLFPAGAWSFAKLVIWLSSLPPPYRCCTLCYGQVRSLLRSQYQSKRSRNNR